MSGGAGKGLFAMVVMSKEEDEHVFINHHEGANRYSSALTRCCSTNYLFCSLQS